MPGTTTRIPALRLFGFLSGVLALTLLFGCGSEDPAKKEEKNQVMVPVTPGVYHIVSEISGPDTSGAIVTIKLDTTDVICEFDVTGFVEANQGIPLKITDAQVDETDGRYTIGIEFSSDILLPCILYFTMNLEGTVTDTTVYFEGETFLGRIGATDDAYKTVCQNQYKAFFADTTNTVFDAVKVAPDTAGVCSP